MQLTAGVNDESGHGVWGHLMGGREGGREGVRGEGYFGHLWVVVGL